MSNIKYFLAMALCILPMGLLYAPPGLEAAEPDPISREDSVYHSALEDEDDNVVVPQAGDVAIRPGLINPSPVPSPVPSSSPETLSLEARSLSSSRGSEDDLDVLTVPVPLDQGTLALIGANELVLVVVGNEWRLSGHEVVQHEAFAELAQELAQKSGKQSARVIYPSSKKSTGVAVDGVGVIKAIQSIRGNLQKANNVEIVTFCYGHDSVLVNAVITEMPPFSIDMAIQINPHITSEAIFSLNLQRIKKLYAFYSKASLPAWNALAGNVYGTAVRAIQAYAPSSGQIAAATTGGATALFSVGVGAVPIGIAAGIASAQVAGRVVDAGTSVAESARSFVVQAASVARSFFSTVGSPVQFTPTEIKVHLPGTDVLAKLPAGDRKYKQHVYVLNDKAHPGKELLTFPVKNIRLCNLAGGVVSDLSLEELRSAATISKLATLCDAADNFNANFDLMVMIQPNDPPVCIINRHVAYDPEKMQLTINDGNCEYVLCGLEATGGTPGSLHSLEIAMASALFLERFHDDQQWELKLKQVAEAQQTRWSVASTARWLGSKTGMHHSRTIQDINAESMKMMWQPVNRLRDTPFHIAALSGSLNLEALNHRMAGEGSAVLSDITLPNVHGDTPLHYLVRNHVMQAERFLENCQKKLEKVALTDSGLIRNEIDKVFTMCQEAARRLYEMLKVHHHKDCVNKAGETPLAIVVAWNDEGIGKICNDMYNGLVAQIPAIKARKAAVIKAAPKPRALKGVPQDATHDVARSESEDDGVDLGIRSWWRGLLRRGNSEED